jgi:protein phosphatase
MSDFLDLDTDEFSGPEDKGFKATIQAKAPVRVEFGAVSDIGKVRATNQDHFLVTRIARTLDVLETNLPDGELPARIEDFAYGMVVADGMGGMANGERASILAIQTGVKLVFESPRWALRIDEHEAQQLIERMRQYVRKVDETLTEQARFDPSLSGMGTTLTVAYSVDTHAFVVHAGDSRAYLFHEGELHRLTRDHTVAQELADDGRIPHQTLKAHATRHLLTNFAGGPPRGIIPEISTLELADGDRLLLCSDGLTEMIEDREIAEILDRQSDPRAAARALVGRAIANGGRDNVTVVLARYTVPVDPNLARSQRVPT